MPPKCRPPESYFPSTSRNTPLQGDELRDQNIEAVDQVVNDDMDGDNISDTNQKDEIHRLIQDTFFPMDEDNQDYSHYVDPLLKKSSQPLYEGSKKTFICYIVLVQPKGFKWFIKHMSHTDTKVFNLLIIYACMFTTT